MSKDVRSINLITGDWLVCTVEDSIESDKVLLVNPFVFVGNSAMQYGGPLIDRDTAKDQKVEVRKSHIVTNNTPPQVLIDQYLTQLGDIVISKPSGKLIVPN